MSRILWLSADRGVDPAVPKGASAHLRNTVRAFRALGHEVLVLTPSAADPEDLGAEVARIATPATFRDLLAEAEAPAPRERRAAHAARLRVVRALGHAWNQVLVEQALERHVPAFRPDFVFERYNRFGVAGVLTCRRLGARHLLNVHAQLAWEGETFRRQALADGTQVTEQLAFEHASRIVVNSRELRAQLVEAGVDPAKVRVVINGVHLDQFSDEGPARRPPGTERSFVIGFVGSLKPWHGLGVLADAFRALAADPRVHLVVVGDGPERAVVAALADELPGRVTAPGAVPLDEVPAWTRGCDVTVAPYPPLERFYYSPIKILESLSCGRPVVASALGQVVELVRDGVTGLLVPPGDAAALAAALRRLADDPGLAARMGRAARAEAEEKHSWNARAAELVEHGLGIAP